MTVSAPCVTNSRSYSRLANMAQPKGLTKGANREMAETWYEAIMRGNRSPQVQQLRQSAASNQFQAVMQGRSAQLAQNITQSNALLDRMSRGAVSKQLVAEEAVQSMWYSTTDEYFTGEELDYE